MEQLDHLELLAKELTDGTMIPFDYARETLKLCALAALGQNPDRPRELWMPVHTRQYLILVSDVPGAGKGQSMHRIKRTIQKSALEGLPWPVQFIRGESLGSPQYAVTELGGELERVGKPKPVSNLTVEIDRSVVGRIVHYDEGRMLAEKDNNAGSGRGLFSLYTMLYEDNAASTGSFKNGKAKVEQADVSLSLHFTRAGFDSTFTGAGHTSGGFLSRCTLVSQPARKPIPVWPTVDSAKIRELVAKILEDCKRRELPQDDIESIRNWVATELGKAEPNKASRLPFLFAQECYARAMFSESGRLTKEIARKAADWTMGQLLARASLWPLDQSGDKYERVHLALVAAFQKSPVLSLIDMKRAVHLHRQGSGGVGVFMSVVKQMVAAQETEPHGSTRKGTPLFRWLAEPDATVPTHLREGAQSGISI